MISNINDFQQHFPTQAKMKSVWSDPFACTENRANAFGHFMVILFLNRKLSVASCDLGSATAGG